MKVYLTLLLLPLLQILSSSALPLDGESFGCGFDDNDLIVNVSSRSPHSTGTWFKWVDGKIPYYFKGDVKKGDKELTRDIMREIESHTCFKYIEHTTEPTVHHMEIVVEAPTCYQNGFSAYVQPQSWTKVLLRSFKQLTDHESCDNRGGFTHEMMHALGVGHTQKRADRDKYIKVNKDNIQKWSQYEICHECKLYGDVSYDCSSIMHYGQGTFSTGKNTMEAIDPQTCKLSWSGPAFSGDKKPTASDWKLLEIISGQVCDMNTPRWLTWSEWSACSEPCGDGKKTRTRTCSVAGKCQGETQQEAKCSLKDTYKEPEKCPYWKDDCKEGQWKDWMQKWCARTCNCGGGEDTATWSTWGDWSGCSATCGDGTKTRSRTCSVTGKCPGESQQTSKCDLPKCATWSSWGAWGSCSATCGDATKSRTRTCSVAGKCDGEDQETNKCDLPKCVEGGCVTDKGACVFPFTYRDVTYNGCTVAHHNQAWCQTKDSWGNCPTGCKMHTADSGTCETPNGACIFPFTYSGKTYSACTKDSWDRFWCQTKADMKGTWWGVCPAECQKPKDENETECKTTTGYDCVFPFIYDGKSYGSCTTEGPFGGNKWCAIKVDANNEFIDGYWGYCQANC